MRRLVNTIRQAENGIRQLMNYILCKTTTVSKDGKTINAINHQNAELRDIKVVSPYGISSSSVDKMPIQTIVNNADTITMVGVFDKDKPPVEPGEVILYSKFKQKIILGKDGKIKFKLDDKDAILIDNTDIRLYYGSSSILVSVLVDRLTTAEGNIRDLQQKVASLESLSHSH